MCQADVLTTVLSHVEHEGVIASESVIGVDHSRDDGMMTESGT